ncbi:HIT family protein [Kocuria sp. JC486]|uniref:HIT family protein n=1 Tax=Kocuria soli TaxID=2485125 RepID=A0A3N3ZTG6_9MICC|nr:MULTISPECIES: HIT family protein [Kocuria]NHU84538.1 HIT family protein [Kocuria sp. JC486]ROZ63048.1 HIT family protein [Kocuria soli]
MSTIFTKIIDGEIPGRFVWQDERCVAFLSIAPLAQGHTLVVPREEVDHWLDLEPELAAHLMKVSQVIGQAQDQVWSPKRVGQMIQGFEVPHCHIHVWPTNSIEEFDFANVDQNPDPELMEQSAERIRQALRSAGHEQQVPQS